MHDIRFIRDNPDAFDRGLARRGLEPQAQRLISIDERRRAIIRVNERASARRKAVPKEMAKAKSEGDGAVVQKLMSEAVELKATIARTDEEQKAVEKELRDALAEIPNLPLDDVPDGKDSNDNVEHHRFGAKREYAFAPKQHFDLGEALGQMDFETAAKLSGARFVVLKKGLARLERALGQFMLDVHTSEPHNYTEISPPLIVRKEAMFGTAQLPKFEEDQFKAIRHLTKEEGNEALQRLREEDHGYDPKEQASAFFERIEVLGSDGEESKELFTEAGWKRFQELQKFGEWWLIPTAEVPLTNLVR